MSKKGSDTSSGEATYSPCPQNSEQIFQPDDGISKRATKSLNKSYTPTKTCSALPEYL
jgi:hypothetical protein